ncbi:MAG: FAD-dependent monooxygenase [Alphaproteobacteria bacterium]|nr:FAD-dependent monooxygenase [Alphaproteobacteria bacterium]
MGLEQYGFNIPGDVLVSALYEHATTRPGLDIIFSDSFTESLVEGSQINVVLKSGTSLSARLLVGADGRNSAVREDAGITVKKHDYGQSAITCLISHTRVHDNISTEFHRPAGPLAFVPMPGNTSSIVWVERTDKVDEILRLKKNEFTALLEKLSGSFLGALTLESPPASWPLCAITAGNLTAPRTALIAEAAHVMSPITAQGLNLSLRDVAALAEVLTDAARAGIDIGSTAVLDSYARRRLPDMTIRTQGVDGMMRLVSTEHGLIKALRRTGLKAVSGIPPLKNLAMHHGLAPAIDRGRLSKGGKL